jgi:hypothetical protein
MNMQITSALDASANMYYRLILLVGSEANNTKNLRELSKKLDTLVINVNLELSKRLLNKTARQRKLDLVKSMQEIVRNREVSLLDHTGILFDLELGQDPLRLLEGISRNQTVIASWNGEIQSGKLTYAQQGHPEYRSYSTKDLLVIETNMSKANR